MLLPSKGQAVYDLVAAGALVAAFLLSFIWNPAVQMPLAGGTIALAALALLCARHPDARGSHPIFWVLYAVLLWFSVRALTSDIPARSIAFLGGYALPILVALRVAGLHADLTRRYLIGPVYVTLALIAAWTIVTQCVPALHPWLRDLGRSGWPFENPNHLAMTMNAGIFLSFSLWGREPAGPRRQGLLLGLVFCFLALLMTGSRGGVMGLMAGVVLLVGLYPDFLRRVPKRGWIMGLTTTLLFLILFSLFLPRGLMGITGFAKFVTHPEAILESRPDLWAATLSLIITRPFFGFGTGTFAAVFPQVMTPAHQTSAYAAHNDFLQITLETGLIGGALYLALGGMVVTLLFSLRRAGRLSFAQAGAGAGLAALFIHAQVEFMWGVFPALFLSGLLLGVILKEQREAPGAQRYATIPRGAAAVLGRAEPARLLALVIAMSTCAGLYAEGQINRAARALNRGDVAAFSEHLHRAQAFSFDLHAMPYVYAADYRLMLNLSGANGPGFDDIQTQLTQALKRDPYLPAAHELQGRLDEAQGKSPLPAWEKGLSLEPRSAQLRLDILRYHEKRGHKAQIEALVQETRAWPSLRGPVFELKAALAPYRAD